MYNLYAQFPKQQVVRDRQYSALIRWSAYIMAQPIPPEKPDESWVEQRVIAEQMPNQMDMHVTNTLSWVIRDQNIQTNIRQHLSAFNDETTEAAMDTNVEGALSAQMPPYCHSIIATGEVEFWYNEHGFGEPVSDG